MREITWYVKYQTLKNHCNLEFMKLLMLKLWQNSLIRKNCSTFIVLTLTILSISMHGIEKRDTAFLLYRHPGGGGTPIHYLYGYVPPNRVVILKLLI